MIISYTLQFLDKTTLAYTSILGLPKDINLRGQQYSWASSAFYFGYMVASYPASLAFVKFPLGKFLSISVCIWAIILPCHGATSSFTGLVIARIFLGVFESVVSPGFSLVTGMWYKPSEHPSRHAIWFAGNGFASLFGGLIAYGVSHIHNGMAPWRWLFIIFGLITFAWSIVLLLFLPDSPLSARFLKPFEQNIAMVRSQRNLHTRKDGQWKKSQMLEALIDPKTWLLFAYTFLTSLPNGALTSFSALIIEGFGYNIFKTLLMGMPTSAFQLFYTLSAAFFASKIRRSRCIIIACLSCFSLLGCLLVRELPPSNKIGKLFGIWMFGAYAAGFPLSLSIIASDVAGFTKKTTVSAVLFVAYCAGNIVGPQLFKAAEKPTYPTAFTAMLTCFCLAIGVITALRIVMDLQNKKRDKDQGVNIDPGKQDNEECQVDMEVVKVDETDWENRKFRYIL